MVQVSKSTVALGRETPVAPAAGSYGDVMAKKLDSVDRGSFMKASAVAQARSPAWDSDERAEAIYPVLAAVSSSTSKCIVFLVAGLMFGALASEAWHAKAIGSVGFDTVVRCISMGP
jgi:hypothetical protein